MLTGQERVCNFENKDLQLWQKGAPFGTVPVALPSNRALLDIWVTAESAYLNKAYILTATVDGNDHPASVELRTTTTKIPGVQIALVKSGSVEKPWRFKAFADWRLEDNATKKQYDLGSTSVEVYILSPDVPKYLTSAGIPLRLLDEVIPEWMKQRSDVEWPAFFIDYLFDNPKLWYET